MGDNALALVRELGNRDLGPLAKPSAARRHLLPGARPAGPLPGHPRLAAGGRGAARPSPSSRSSLRRRGISSLRRTAGATALAAVPIVLGPLAAQGLWSLLVADPPGLRARCSTRGGPAGSGWPPSPRRRGRAALVRAAAPPGRCRAARAGRAGLAGGARRPSLAAQAPGGSYLVAWPALAGAVTGIVAAVSGNRGGRLGAALVGGAVAVVVLAPTVALFFPALGLRTAAVGGFVAALLVVALLPAFELLFPDEDTAGAGGSPSAVVPGVAVVLAVACAAVGLSVDRFDVAPPGAQPARLRAGPRHAARRGGPAPRGAPARTRAVRRRAAAPARRLPVPGRPDDGDRRRPAGGPAGPAGDHGVRRRGRWTAADHRAGHAAAARRPAASPSTWRGRRHGGPRPVGRPRRPRGGARGATAAHHLPRAAGRRPAGQLHRRGRRAGRPPGHRRQRRPVRPARLQPRPTASTRPARTAPTWCWSPRRRTWARSAGRRRR